MRLCLAAIALGLAATARAQNLVPDPAFRFDTGAWTGSSLSGNYTMTFAPGFSARPGSGSALLSLDFPAGGTYSVCVGVAGGRTYEWGYSIFFPDASRTTGLNETLAAWDGPACTGSQVGGYVLPIVPGGSLGAWRGGRALVFPAPASCRSILVGFAAVGVPVTRATAYVDDVFLALAGTVPPIEPEPLDVPSLSTLGVLALGAALALAAARLLAAAPTSSA